SMFSQAWFRDLRLQPLHQVQTKRLNLRPHSTPHSKLFLRLELNRCIFLLHTLYYIDLPYRSDQSSLPILAALVAKLESLYVLEMSPSSLTSSGNRRIKSPLRRQRNWKDCLTNQDHKDRFVQLDYFRQNRRNSGRLQSLWDLHYRIAPSLNHKF